MKEFCDKWNISEDEFYGREDISGDLDLRSLTSIPEGFNPTVGGDLYLRNGLEAETKTPPHIITWSDGKFCLADGVFSKVVTKSSIDGHTIWKLRKIGKSEAFFMVEKGELAAHGETIRDALIDLRFKSEDRDKSDYEDLTTESELSLEDAVVCYRVITGACKFGTQEFLKRLPEVKEQYKVSEILKLTQGEYGGSEFAAFIQSETPRR